MKRIPSLDGLRALSISIVIAGHIWNAGEVRYGWHSVWGKFLDGSQGVFIFFIISGYIITKLLLREYDRRGTYSLGRFYYRRFFRIVPPLYFYVLFIVVTGHLSGLYAQPRNVLTALTFTRNLDPHSSQFMFEHFWSLCIEEQFYLCWPLVLLFALRGPSGRRRASWLSIFLIVAAPLYRLTSYPSISNIVARHFVDGLLPAHMDALMFGCIVALAEGSTKFEALYQLVGKFAWLLPIWFFGISASLYTLFGNRYRLSIGETLDGIAVAFMMLWVIRNSNSFFGRVLNWRPVVHVGVISYSIYIWQTYFLHHANATVFGRLPWSLVCILGAAEFSWQTVERGSRVARDWGENQWAKRVSLRRESSDSLALRKTVSLGEGENL